MSTNSEKGHCKEKGTERPVRWVDQKKDEGTDEEEVEKKGVEGIEIYLTSNSLKSETCSRDSCEGVNTTLD